MTRWLVHLLPAVAICSLGCDRLFPFKTSQATDRAWEHRGDGSSPDGGTRDGERPLEAGRDRVPLDTPPPPDSAPAPDSPAPDEKLLLAEARPLEAKPPDAHVCVHPPVQAACANGSCLVPAGCFLMGSPATEPCRAALETQHEVTLTRSFLIGETEVTQQEFGALLGYQPSFFKACGATCPVEQVTWHEAATYCNARSAKEGLSPCYACTGTGPAVTCQQVSAYQGSQIYNCPGYRLPTEAEWEYAMRAGTKTPLYNGPITTCLQKLDPNAAAIAWYTYNANNKTHPAGQKTPNPWGLHDMAGNTWEWTGDWYQADLGSAAALNPIGAATGLDRTIRGGAYPDAAGYMRSAARYPNSPSAKATNTQGFRCVRSL